MFQVRLDHYARSLMLALGGGGGFEFSMRDV